MGGRWVELIWNLLITGMLCGAVAEIARFTSSRDAFHACLGVVLAFAYTVHVRKETP